MVTLVRTDYPKSPRLWESTQITWQIPLVYHRRTNWAVIQGKNQSFFVPKSKNNTIMGDRKHKVWHSIYLKVCYSGSCLSKTFHRDHSENTTILMPDIRKCLPAEWIHMRWVKGLLVPGQRSWRPGYKPSVTLWGSTGTSFILFHRHLNSLTHAPRLSLQKPNPQQSIALVRRFVGVSTCAVYFWTLQRILALCSKVQKSRLCVFQTPH